MLFFQFCQLRRLVFDQSTPVQPISESRGGTLSVSYTVAAVGVAGRYFPFLIQDCSPIEGTRSKLLLEFHAHRISECCISRGQKTKQKGSQQQKSQVKWLRKTMNLGSFIHILANIANHFDIYKSFQLMAPTPYFSSLKRRNFWIKVAPRLLGGSSHFQQLFWCLGIPMNDP